MKSAKKMMGIAALLGLTIAGSAMARDYRVIARGGANDQAQVKGVYRERMVGTTLVQRFNVEAEDFTPNTRYEVRVNGSLFGTLTTNSLGIAELEFKTFVPDNNPHDEDPPLPTDFPRLVAGDTISVGNVSATFR